MRISSICRTRTKKKNEDEKECAPKIINILTDTENLDIKYTQENLFSVIELKTSLMAKVLILNSYLAT